MKRICLSLATVMAALLPSLSQALPSSSEPPFAIAIHGGAGTINRSSLSAEQQQAYETKLAEAVNAGYEILAQQGEALDAVIAAIQILEESPLFNAGKGAVYTYEGGHELDASLMHGGTLQAGAVSGVTTVKSPIALARAVMEKSVHVMLSGRGAEQFAAEQGLELVDNSYFNTEHRYRQLEAAKKRLGVADYQAYQALDDRFKYGTVGAVALDKHGNLVAGTSTGGMTAKRWGRVGDAPIIGAGTWADNSSCAVSATGHGEYFIRYHVAADICARVKYQGVDIYTAGDQVIHQVLKDVGGTGGVIIMDRQGRVHMPFNTEGMYRAARRGNGTLEVGIYQPDKR